MLEVLFIFTGLSVFKVKKVANQDREIAEKSRRDLFRSVREDFIDMNYESVLPANIINGVIRERAKCLLFG